MEEENKCYLWLPDQLLQQACLFISLTYLLYISQGLKPNLNPGKGVPSWGKLSEAIGMRCPMGGLDSLLLYPNLHFMAKALSSQPLGMLATGHFIAAYSLGFVIYLRAMPQPYLLPLSEVTYPVIGENIQKPNHLDSTQDNLECCPRS